MGYELSERETTPTHTEATPTRDQTHLNECGHKKECNVSDGHPWNHFRPRNARDEGKDDCGDGEEERDDERSSPLVNS